MNKLVPHRPDFVQMTGGPQVVDVISWKSIRIWGNCDAVTDRASALLLNDRQKQCLRLVYENLEAKEIAQRLSLSPHTVNEHLRDARRILGVSRSLQAARLLADVEGHERLVPKPFGVDPAPDPVEQGDEPEAAGPEVPVTRNRYRLTAIQRLGIVLGLALGIVVLGGALVATADLVGRLMSKYRVDISDGPYKR
ncbi:helix-turn-helix domain-containing protein [Sphingomonas sp. NFX23]|uniref:helix-turn-helix domain-containing protein n=1 Tax=Sphingomonas sp. NFX23 TaxID=2819532 RepID=UPI003CF92CC0